MKNISKPVADAIDRRDPRAVAGEEREMKFLQDVCNKYHVDPMQIVIVITALQGLGFGRNTETTNLLRVVIEMMESDQIERAEDVEARLNSGPTGKL